MTDGNRSNDHISEPRVRKLTCSYICLNIDHEYAVVGGQGC
jgi:hypothetical protein